MDFEEAILIKTLVDTCIFVDLFRGNQQVQEKLQNIDPVINSVVYMELVQGAHNKPSLQQLERFLKQFDLLDINESISVQAIQLMSEFSKSHGLKIPDSLIAATYLVHKTNLWTDNQKDFAFIPTLRLHEK